MSSYDTVLLERNGPVATLTLNRPDSLNAFDGALRRDFLAAIREVNGDESIAVVLLTGAGRGFSAGADLNDTSGQGAGDIGQLTEDQLNHEYKPAVLAIADSPKLWIAAINGPCAGIGSAFAMSCDLVVMAEDAYIYQAFAAISLVPDGGVTWHLNRILGPKRALELILSGEKMRGQRCLELGLCNRVVPAEQLMEEATAWARELSAKAPMALRYSKESLAFASQANLGDVISNEARLQKTCIGSGDFAEGVAAFMEKRAPAWKGE